MGPGGDAGADEEEPEDGPVGPMPKPLKKKRDYSWKAGSPCSMRFRIQERKPAVRHTHTPPHHQSSFCSHLLDAHYDMHS
jgi:hypothetical protein